MIHVEPQTVREEDRVRLYRRVAKNVPKRIEPSPRRWEKLLDPVGSAILRPIFFNAENGGSILLRNVSVYLDTNRISKARRLQSEDN